MKRISKLVVCAALACVSVTSLISFPSTAAPRAKLRGEYAPGEVIVKLKSSADAKCLKKKNAASAYGSGMSIKSASTFGRKNKLRFVTVKNKSKSTAELIETLSKNENVEYVMPNYIKRQASVTNDSYVDYQWGIENNGNQFGTKAVDTSVHTQWNNAAKSQQEQVVAVIDSGIDLEHEDLKDVLWTNPFSSSELNGVHGYDFTNTISSREPVDDDGHGTHIAGIIAAAANNGKGVCGVNASNVKIMALKASNGGNFYSSDEMAAFEYVQEAARLGVNIVAVNCSYCGEGSLEDKKAYDSIFDSLGELGIVTCVAAGNDYTNLDDHSGGVYMTPACTDSKYAVTVGASNERDEKSAFSNYSPDYVDIAAPGSNILSTFHEDTFQPTIYDDEKRSRLCSYYQSFDSDIAEGEFGLPEVLEGDGKVSVGFDENFFGISGRSLSVESDNSGDKYFLEFPYTLPSDSGEYYISLVAKSLKNSDCFLVDVPRDFDSKNNADVIKESGHLFGSYGSDAWDHFCFKYNTTENGYLQGSERKLVIYMYDTEGAVLLDDIAVSVMNPDSAEFGRYEFSNGSSMSAGFVSGAVALCKNINNELSCEEIIAAIKQASRISPGLTESVSGGFSLYLGKLDEYIIEKEPETTQPVTTQPESEQQTAETTPTDSTVPAVTEPTTSAPKQEKTSLSLTSYSKKLYVGKKYKITTNIKNAKGATTFKSSNTSVAKVSANGTVKAIKKGTAYIKVVNNGSSKTLKITVKNPKLNKTSKTLRIGKSFKIKIAGKVGAAKFVSSNKKIAAVSKSGKVKAKKKGRAVITVVTNGKIKLKCKIKVK